jgi:hypothetical protein
MGKGLTSIKTYLETGLYAGTLIKGVVSKPEPASLICRNMYCRPRTNEQVTVEEQKRFSVVTGIQIPFWTRGILLIALATLTSCTRAIRSGALIDRYSRAACIPVKFGPGISPPTRAWNYTLKTRDGVAVHVSGAEMPGGRIDVRYASDGKSEVAADAGDYIYPADVRLDAATDRLYIRASGVPAHPFGGAQTWLFEYDLKNQRQTGKARVDPSVLPEECPTK